MKKAAVSTLGIIFLFLLAAGFVGAQKAGSPEKASPSEALLRYLGKGKVDLKVVESYLEQGADVNYRDRRGVTPLHQAAGYGHADAVKTLLDRGALVNAVDNDKRSPLHDAVSSRSMAAVRLLTANGADVNLKDKDGHTPLYGIVFWDDNRSAMEALDLFLTKGFDIAKSTDAKFLNEAIARGRRDLALVLLRKGARFDDESIVRSAGRGYEDIFAILLEKGADPNQKAILRASCAAGNVTIAGSLVAKGITPSAEDIDVCLYHGHREAAVYLNGILKKATGKDADMKARCRLAPDGGQCKALFWRAYFDPVSGTCKEFAYGGCGGVSPFEDLEACRRVCGK